MAESMLITIAKASTLRGALQKVIQQGSLCQNPNYRGKRELLGKEFHYFDVHVHIGAHVLHAINETHRSTSL